MNYRSITDLNDAIHRNRWKLPHRIDLVVGIPRSGLLAANILSLSLNVPMTDVEGLLVGRVLTTGRSRRAKTFIGSVSGAKNIVVIDDSVSMGLAMRGARNRISDAFPGAQICYCAVYGSTGHHPDVDVVLEVVPQPRIFQWNVMHHGLLEHCCVDIDGVLCCDPSETQNDDGEAYEAFLANAFALDVPTKRIGWLVTSRLEKYRSHTEKWLADRDIDYGKLLMLDLPSKEERIRCGAHGTFKAGVYSQLPKAVLFIESEHRQAEVIARLSGKPVLCTETQILVSPPCGSLTALKQSLRTFPLRMRLGKTPTTSLQALAVRVRGIIGARSYGHLRRLVRRRSA
jgi:uncharacterized HAD superfamily protein/hypoxanthine phosphoribosyltransferase